ncbi:hypothetical protein C8Q80DRAFT_1119983 [Daedaleopsis nitida]|nr:hypothetical protein C8Q80DRAFT_1119983 [Daedaleopsis nitida]
MSSAPTCTIIVHLAGEVVTSPRISSGLFGSSGGFSSFGSLSSFSTSSSLQSSPSCLSLSALTSDAGSDSLPDDSLLLPPGASSAPASRKIHPAYSPAPSSGDRCVLVPNTFFERQQQQPAKPQADANHERGRTLFPVYGTSIFRPSEQRLEELRQHGLQLQETRVGTGLDTAGYKVAGDMKTVDTSTAVAAAVEAAVEFETASAVAAFGAIVPVVLTDYIRFAVAQTLFLTKSCDYWVFGVLCAGARTVDSFIGAKGFVSLRELVSGALWVLGVYGFWGIWVLGGFGF